jgi:hypothetical protein
MGEDHQIVMHILENKYSGNEPFKGGFNKKNQYKQNVNNKRSVWL